MAAKKRHDRMTPWLWLIVGGLMATAAVVLLVGLAGMEGNSLRATTYIPSYTPTPTIPESEYDYISPWAACYGSQCIPMNESCQNSWEYIKQKCLDWGRTELECNNLKSYGVDNCVKSMDSCEAECRKLEEV